MTFEQDLDLFQEIAFSWVWGSYLEYLETVDILIKFFYRRIIINY